MNDFMTTRTCIGLVGWMDGWNGFMDGGMDMIPGYHVRNTNVDTVLNTRC